MGTSKHVVGLVTAVAVTGLASAALGTGAASAESLGNVTKSKKVGGGSVTISLLDQKYSVEHPVTNVPLSREVFVSGKVRVKTGGDFEGGTVTAGYLVGCQFNFGAGSGGFAGITSSDDPDDSVFIPNPQGGDPINTHIDSGNGVTGGIVIGPGEAKFVPVIKASIGGEPVNSFTFTGSEGGVAFSQERFGVDGCAGFAEARALINVQVSSDDSKANVTLYGRTFSLG